MAWPFARLMQIVKSAHSSGSEPSSGFRHRRHKYTHSADTASVEFKGARLPERCIRRHQSGVLLLRSSGAASLPEARSPPPRSHRRPARRAAFFRAVDGGRIVEAVMQPRGLPKKTWQLSFALSQTVST